MNVAKTIKRMEWKECKYPFCINRFYGSQFQKYCNDDRCKEIRKEARKKKKEASKLPKTEVNRIVCRATVKRAISMQKKVVTLRCRAKDANGKICGKSFKAVLEVKRSVYPMYCEEHRNEYKRKRFALSSGSKNAKAKC